MRFRLAMLTAALATIACASPRAAARPTVAPVAPTSEPTSAPTAHEPPPDDSPVSPEDARLTPEQRATRDAACKLSAQIDLLDRGGDPTLDPTQSHQKVLFLKKGAKKIARAFEHAWGRKFRKSKDCPTVTAWNETARNR